MKKSFLFPLFIFFITNLSAQIYRAQLRADFSIQVDTLPGNHLATARDDSFEQMAGFPKRTVANPTFKNFRNVTLADLDQDGSHEILLASNNVLQVYHATGLFWEKSLEGVAIYPPSVADVNQDGLLEIVQTTGGQPANGRLYLLDHQGNDLSGWPLSFNDNWMLSAAALADVDGDKNLEIIVSERIPPAGVVHVLQLDGSELNSNWPVSLGTTPAVTPSIGDVDQDGEMDIVVHSSEGRYVFDLAGQVKSGFPQITAPDQRYSFQSPLLVDFNEDEHLEIVGTAHGDAPEFYVLQSDGSQYGSWPNPVPDATWTFNPPTVVKVEEEWLILNSRKIGADVEDMLYAWNSEGELAEGFPIEKTGGLEGYIAVADVDDDGAFEILFGANIIDNDGKGFIHAYELDGSGEVPGFPIRTRGWTFMNGVSIGDINGDEQMDLAVLSYTQNFGAAVDSTILNVYELEVPYHPDRVLWGTYKGDNSRSGWVRPSPLSAVNEVPLPALQASLYPNPASKQIELSIDSPGLKQLQLEIYDTTGNRQQQSSPEDIPPGIFQTTLSLADLHPGHYLLKISSQQKLLRSIPLAIVR